VEVELEGALLDPSSDAAATEAGEPGVSGRVLVADDCRIAPTARLDGPVVIGRGSTVGAGSRVKESVLLPSADVPEDALVAGAVYGRRA
jgi:acetyltransferase-like isoleucine patch superfamily enzyme